MNIKELLKGKYGWKDIKLIQDYELINIYTNANYCHPPLKMIRFLSLFYNLNFKFNETDINFDIKNILKRNPYHLYFDQYCETLGVTNITPFAEIEEGYTVVVADDNNNIYGICDDWVVGLGDDYFKMLDNIAQNSYWK